MNVLQLSVTKYR